MPSSVQPEDVTPARGFTDVLQIVQAIKQVGWNPHLVGWGNLAVFGVTAAQVPPGTVDSCDYRCPTSPSARCRPDRTTCAMRPADLAVAMD